MSQATAQQHRQRRRQQMERRPRRRRTQQRARGQPLRRRTIQRRAHQSMSQRVCCCNSGSGFLLIESIFHLFCEVGTCAAAAESGSAVFADKKKKRTLSARKPGNINAEIVAAISRSRRARGFDRSAMDETAAHKPSAFMITDNSTKVSMLKAETRWRFSTVATCVTRSVVGDEKKKPI
jgi:hypothetical protein